MNEVTAADEKEHLGHFYDSPRHRMQVDFNVYVADLHKEIAAGTERATDGDPQSSDVLSGPGPKRRVTGLPVVVTGVDPVTFRFSGGRSAN